MGFRIIEEIVSGDFVFQAWGNNIEELFAACAEACFSAMTDPAAVEPKNDYPVKIKAENLEDLLYNFLAELIYLKDIDKIFFSKFDIEIDIEEVSLNAVAWGETIDYNKHEIKTDVKAVTYHDLKIVKSTDRYEVKVILDL